MMSCFVYTILGFKVRIKQFYFLHMLEKRGSFDVNDVLVCLFKHFLQHGWPSLKPLVLKTVL